MGAVIVCRSRNSAEGTDEGRVGEFKLVCGVLEWISANIVSRSIRYVICRSEQDLGATRSVGSRRGQRALADRVVECRECRVHGQALSSENMGTLICGFMGDCHKAPANALWEL